MNPLDNIGYVISEAKQPVEEYKVISDKGGKIIAQGYLQTELDKKNRNGRIYGIPGIKKEVEGPRLKELMSTGNLKGEDGHPSDPSLAVQQTINPKVTCVKYLDVWMDGDNVAAKFCGTNTQYGKAFNEDLMEGELPAYSLRALGSVTMRNGICYVEGTKIVTWDRVYYPSHEKAYTTKILSEAAGLSQYDHYMQLESVTSDKGVLIPITNQSMISFVKQESANIKAIMESFDTLFQSMQIIDNGRSIQMVTNEGAIMVITLENYVQNQIMDYCDKM